MIFIVGPAAGYVCKYLYMILKEWLLIAWVGTSTNFVVLSTHPTATACDRARTVAITQRTESSGSMETQWICTQSLGEGRSQLPKRPGSGGIAGKTSG